MRKRSARRLNRQDLVRRAEEEIERRRPIMQQQAAHWWSDQADAEVRAFRAGGPLPTSAEGLELLAIEIQLDERV